jgi:hypothetical protein
MNEPVFDHEKLDVYRLIQRTDRDSQIPSEYEYRDAEYE